MERGALVLAIGAVLALSSFALALWAYLNPGGPWPLGPIAVGLVERLANVDFQGPVGEFLSTMIEAMFFAILLVLALLIGHLLMDKGIEMMA